MSDCAEGARLREIVARMRQYAPSLRGTGMTASDASYNRTLADAAYLDELCRESASRIEIGPIELLALKKLALVNGALAKTLTSASARAELTALLGVLMDVTNRADIANSVKEAKAK